jgi:hypothetical protein
MKPRQIKEVRGREAARKYHWKGIVFPSRILRLKSSPTFGHVRYKLRKIRLGLVPVWYRARLLGIRFSLSE